jgi:hypothetical protein
MAAALVALVVASAPLAAQVCRDCPVTARDSASMTSHIFPALGLRVGSPQKISGALGLVMGTEWTKGGKDRTRDAAIFIEPGLSAGRVSAAFLTGFGNLGSGFGIAATALRTWKDPWTLPENTTYVGGEVIVWPVVLFGPRLGLFRRLSGDNRSGRWFLSADIGFGL